mmetsp:Transcript_15903/g.30775  ORF Transcript_15903/g.30775 Transcript_15903/m.30775 type:complete len:593 (+) Transcript_15903:465-2243(+)
MGLSNTDGKLTKSEVLVALELLGGKVRELNSVGTIDLYGNALDLVAKAHLERVKELETRSCLASPGVCAGLDNGLSEFNCSSTTLGPVVCHDSIIRSCLDGSLAHKLNLGLGISGELVDAADGSDSELVHVANVVLQVANTLGEKLEVLLLVSLVEGLSGGYLRAASVHLKSTDGGDNDRTVRLESAGSALDVEELLCSNISSEASLGENESFLSDELECDLISNKRAVSVGDVGERSCVHKHGGLLERLHESGLDGIKHENGRRSCNSEVLSGNGLSCLRVGNDNASKPLPEVVHGGSQCKNCHALRGDGDVESGFARNSLLFRGGLSNGDTTKVSVAGVHNALPSDRLRVDVESDKAGDLLGGEVRGVGLGDTKLLEAAEHGLGKDANFTVVRAQSAEESLVGLRLLVEHTGIDGGGDEVVSSHHRGDLHVGHVDVEELHGDGLCVSTTTGTTLDTEGRTCTRHANVGEDLLVEVGTERLRESNGGGTLAFAERGRVDAGDKDVVTVLAILEALENLEAHIAHVRAVEVQLLLENASILGNDADVLGLHGCLGDLDVAGNRLQAHQTNASGGHLGLFVCLDFACLLPFRC